MSIATDAQSITDLIIATPITDRGEVLGIISFKLMKTSTHRKFGALLVQVALDYGIKDS